VGVELNEAFAGQNGFSRGLSGAVKKLARRNGRSPGSPVNAHEPYFTAVLDAIDAGQPLPIPPEEARSSVELCTAIYTAAITREAVELPLDSTCRFYNGVSVDDYRNACATAG
jgi:hypothetical protein